MSERETSRNYSKPYRPAILRLYNALGRAKPFDVDQVVAAAQRSTGLSKFGTQAFREPLTQLIASLHESAALSPTGRFMTAQHFAGGLANNLRAGELFAARDRCRLERDHLDGAGGKRPSRQLRSS